MPHLCPHCLCPLISPLLVRWVWWWDWPLIWLTNHCPSVLWHCIFGHMTHQIVCKITYNMSSWTLNHTILYYTTLYYYRTVCSVLYRCCLLSYSILIVYCPYQWKSRIYLGKNVTAQNCAFCWEVVWSKDVWMDVVCCVFIAASAGSKLVSWHVSWHLLTPWVDTTCYPWGHTCWHHALPHTALETAAAFFTVSQSAVGEV